MRKPLNITKSRFRYFRQGRLRKREGPNKKGDRGARGKEKRRGEERTKRTSGW